jgi:hypothetical protein
MNYIWTWILLNVIWLTTTFQSLSLYLFSRAPHIRLKANVIKTSFYPFLLMKSWTRAWYIQLIIIFLFHSTDLPLPDMNNVAEIFWFKNVSRYDKIILPASYIVWFDWILWLIKELNDTTWLYILKLSINE